WREGVGFVLSAAIAAAFTAALLTRLWVPPAISPEPFATFSAASSGTPARLTRGRLHGHPSRELAQVATPHAAVAWSQPRFLMEVTEHETVLELDEGAVRWRVDGVESLRSAPARLRAPEPLALPAAFAKVSVAPNAGCSTAGIEDRLECLDRL